ncbi:MAG: hypothetical protein K5873_06940 [Treponema sp.]|nr:hypothetical protein [Treponema sp.]
MNEIPVKVQVSADDVLIMAECLEQDENLGMKSFAAKFLNFVRLSSEELSEDIRMVDLANPYRMEKIKM